jgi:5-methylcytosine-specific restriction endonuclease McrA
VAKLGYRQTEEHVSKRIATRLETLRARQRGPGEIWLRNRYWNDHKDCVQIGKELDLDPKTIWSYLKHYGIPTRPRGHNVWQLPKDGSAFRGKHHTVEFREAVRQRRLIDGRVPYLKNGVHWLKTAPKSEHPNWKGGISEERQAFYSSPQWLAVVCRVYARDKKTCQRCRKLKQNNDPFDIHHIVSFTCVELRSELSNLVLLCEPCHYWVHGPNNINKEFIKCQ